jgi:outer membrane lipoprotein-sorting protein
VVQFLKQNYSCLLAIVSLSLIPALPACAAPEKQSAESFVIAKFGEADGTALLQQVIQRVKTMHNYWYESTLTTYPKRKPVTEKGRLYFKTPNLIRFEALEAGRRSGSVVVRQPDGKIKAKSGGFLSGVTVSLSPTSKLLQTSNGYNIVESDLASLLEGFLNVSTSDKLLATPSPCSYSGLPRAYVLEVVRSNHQVDQRIVLDSESKLPVDWIIFQDSKLDSQVHVEKLIANANNSDSLFVLGKTSEIAGAGPKSFASADMLSAQRADRLAAIGDMLSPEIVTDISLTIRKIQLDCEQLKNDADKNSRHTILNYDNEPATGDRNQASNSSEAAVLLIRTTSIESLASSLHKVTPIIRKYDATTGRSIDSELLANKWQQSLDKVADSINSIYSSMDEQTSQGRAISENFDNIASETRKLEGILKWVSD